MALMHWSEEMSVGVPELDADHKELIRVINRLAEDYDNRNRRSAVRQSLFSLLRYAEFHFARDEKVMAACGYPEIDEHKRAHRSFIARIRTLNHKFDTDPDGLAEFVNRNLLRFLQDWLNHHILIEDKAYRTAAENNPEARKVAKSFKAIEIWWSR